MEKKLFVVTENSWGRWLGRFHHATEDEGWQQHLEMHGKLIVDRIAAELGGSLTATLSDQGPRYTGSQDQEH